MPTDIPPPGPERDGEIARLLGVAPNRRAIATEDGTSSALTEDDPMGAGLGGYKITAEDVRDFCRKHPRYHVGAWEFWPPYSTDPAACDRLERELSVRAFSVVTNRWPAQSIYPGEVDASVILGFNNDRAWSASAPTRPDAVSAAALLALRGGR
jgi:hypothetical protein